MGACVRRASCVLRPRVRPRRARYGVRPGRSYTLIGICMGVQGSCRQGFNIAHNPGPVPMCS